MENAIYGVFFMMAMLFLYVIFGIDVSLIVILSMIYLKLES